MGGEVGDWGVVGSLERQRRRSEGERERLEGRKMMTVAKEKRKRRSVVSNLRSDEAVAQFQDSAPANMFFSFSLCSSSPIVSSMEREKRFNRIRVELTAKEKKYSKVEA